MNCDRDFCRKTQVKKLRDTDFGRIKNNKQKRGKGICICFFIERSFQKYRERTTIWR